MDQAFTVLRAYTRAHNLRLSDLAQAFIDGPRASRPHHSGQPHRTKDGSSNTGNPDCAQCVRSRGKTPALKNTHEGTPGR
jgi:hypothetical protein